MGILKGVNEERRKIKWSNGRKTTKVFISTIITIFLFVIIISLFSWGIVSIMNLA
ncbi:MAG: hypothetical protein TYPL_4750 [Candidatus Tyloplasma litorale]|nr:MAG: hypothetical protein TYPL_4750 [Mycoplasmatales bacterium]